MAGMRPIRPSRCGRGAGRLAPGAEGGVACGAGGEGRGRDGRTLPCLARCHGPAGSASPATPSRGKGTPAPTLVLPQVRDALPPLHGPGTLLETTACGIGTAGQSLRRLVTGRAHVAFIRERGASGRQPAIAAATAGRLVAAWSAGGNRERKIPLCLLQRDRQDWPAAAVCQTSEHAGGGWMSGCADAGLMRPAPPGQPLLPQAGP